MPESVTLVNPDANPPRVTLSDPTVVTNLRARGYVDAPAGEDVPTGYEALTVEQLKAEVDRRNESRGDGEHLSRSGTKADLIAALEGDDE